MEIPDEVLIFEAGDTVAVTVWLRNNTDHPVDPFGTGATETVLLHHGVRHGNHARKHFRYRGVDPRTGDQVYRGSWTVNRPSDRYYHAVIDAIDNGTIYDTSAADSPYNSTTWGAPYRVVPVD